MEAYIEQLPSYRFGTDQNPDWTNKNM